MPSYVVTRLADLLNDAGLVLSRSTLLWRRSGRQHLADRPRQWSS